MNGMIHIYCGDGKGKTTAALGLALRCSGYGEKIVVAQFQKTAYSGEIDALKRLPTVTHLRINSDIKGFSWQFTSEEKQRRREEHEKLFMSAVEYAKDDCRLLILDEIISAVNKRLMDRKMLLDFLVKKPPELEVVLTGRDPEDALCDMADYVTEMRCVKHPMEKGINARSGIEY